MVKQNLTSLLEDLRLKQQSMMNNPPITALTTPVKKYRILRNHIYLFITCVCFWVCEGVNVGTPCRFHIIIG